MKARDLNLFYACNDNPSSGFTVARGNTTTSGAQTLEAQGTVITLASAPSPTAWVPGQILWFAGGGKEIYVRVLKQVSSTQYKLIPVFTSADTQLVPFQFPSGSTLAVTWTEPCTLVIDLTEAPPGRSYNYLILASASIVGSNPGQVQAAVHFQGLAGDPFGGDAILAGSASSPPVIIDQDNSSGVARYLCNFVRMSNGLLPGHRYEYRWLFHSIAPNTVTIFDSKLAALRFEAASMVAAEDTSETTTATGSFVEKLGIDLLQGFTYFLAGSCLVQSTLNANNVQVRWQASGSSIFHSQNVQMSLNSDWRSSAFVGVYTPGAPGERFSLQHIGASGNTSHVKEARLYAFWEIAGLESMLSSINSPTAVANPSASTWNTAVDDRTHTFETGSYLELVQIGTNGTDAKNTQWRPAFDALPSSLISDPFTHGHAFTDDASTTQPGSCGFFMHRVPRIAGVNQGNRLQGYQAANTTFTATCWFTYLEETSLREPTAFEPTAIFVELETRLLFKNWGTTTQTDTYRHRLPEDVDEISRVLINATEATEVDTTVVSGLTTSYRWFVDEDAHEVNVRMPSGKTPMDVDYHVVVVVWRRYGRTHVDILDNSGNYRPYESLIARVPGSRQELRGQDGKFKAGTTVGTLELLSGDGRFDDMLDAFRGYRCRIWRTYPDISLELDDAELVGTYIQDLPVASPTRVQIRLFDIGVLLERPAATTTVTVYEGASSTARPKQGLPKLWGPLLRQRAYRVTNVSGAGNWNEYQYCDHLIESISAVYIDAVLTATIAGANLDVTSTYISLGRVRVKNDAFPSSVPADMVFVDLRGATLDGTSATRARLYHGEIAYAAAFAAQAALVVTDLDRHSLRQFDRDTRRKLRTSVGLVQGDPPVTGFRMEPGESVSEILDRLAEGGFAYWYTNRAGRLGFAGPDLAAGNLIGNPGFEDDTVLAWPWFVVGATFATTTARKLSGTRSAEVGNASIANSRLEQWCVLGPGKYAFSVGAVLLSGAAGAFYFEIVRPDAIVLQSDHFLIETARWRRLVFSFEIPGNGAGSTLIRIFPAHNLTTATTVGLDEVELVQIAEVIDERNSNIKRVDFEPDDFYQVMVSFGENPEDPDRRSLKNVTSEDARIISTAEPLEKAALVGAGRLDLTGYPIFDEESAGGIAAAAVIDYGRARERIRLQCAGLSRVPLVGERILLEDNTRAPETPAKYPVAQIIAIDDQGDNPKVVELEVRRQHDPVYDRLGFASDTFPVGMISPCLTAGVIGGGDYAELTDLEGLLVKLSATADLVNVGGTYGHVHVLTHTHAVPAHTHTVTPSSVSAATATLSDLAPSGAPDTLPSTNNSTGAHTHTTPSAFTSASSAAGTSPAATPTTLLGPLAPPHRTCRWLRRTGQTSTDVAAEVMFLWDRAALPTGWVRETKFDSRFLRGYRVGGGAVATTIATAAHTPADTPTTLNLAAGIAANVYVGKILKLTSGANNAHVVVVTVPTPTTPTVRAVYVTGDVIVSYAIGSAVASLWSEALDSDWAGFTHKHNDTVPAHTHDSGNAHTHTAVTSTVAASGTAGFTFGANTNNPNTCALDAHTHDVVATSSPPDGTSSGSAGGSTVAAGAEMPPRRALVVIKSSGGAQKFVPAGAMALWDLAQPPPQGWTAETNVEALFLYGAPTGVVSDFVTGEHTHTFTAASHTYSHTHGGAWSYQPAGADRHLGAQVGKVQFGSGLTGVLGGQVAGTYAIGHTHNVTATIGSTNPTLSATAGVTSAAALGEPRHKKLVLIRKA